VWQRIVNELPPHDVYVEPFLGAGAVMRRKRPAARSIGVEIDGGVLRERWRGDELPGLELYHCDGIEWLKHRFALYLVPPPDVATLANAAGNGAVTSRYRPRSPAAGRACGAGSGGSDRAAGNSGPVPAAVPPAGPPELASPAAACQCGDGRRTSEAAAGDGACLVYLDPPYLLSTRRNRRYYDHELTDQRHEELLDVILRLPCLVAISGYDSELYAVALRDWRKIEFTAMTRSGKRAKECLWLNFPEPTELHDPRYAGIGKRERERIGRRVSRLLAKLELMGELERDAVERAVLERRRERRRQLVATANK
jgi:hypothetical protein